MTFEGQYLTYNEYVSLGGTLTEETPFNILEFEARKYLDANTLNRVVDLDPKPQEVKICVFELINLQMSINNGVDLNGNVINYDINQINKQKYDILLKNLSSVLADGVPVLYRGI